MTYLIELEAHPVGCVLLDGAVVEEEVVAVGSIHVGREHQAVLL